MNVDHLQDRLYWGLNRAANILGRPTDAYRPKGPSDPIAQPNRYLRLPAAFSRVDGNFAQPVGYGVAVWRGHFDASYTQVGDYLVRAGDIWFVASQQCLSPVLCVRTNRVLSIARQSAPISGSSDGQNIPSSSEPLISGWPASLLGTSIEGKSPTHLPGDTAIPNMIALLPSIHGQIIQPTDMVTDEYGMNAVVASAELSDLGWRLNIRLVTT
jgi:hypothetical protein